MAGSYALPLNPALGAHSAFRHDTSAHSPTRNHTHETLHSNDYTSTQSANTPQRTLHEQNHNTIRSPRLHTSPERLAKFPAATSPGGMARGQRPRGESDLGRGNALTRNSSNGYSLPPTLKSTAEESPSLAAEDARQDNTTAEVLTSILLPLPFLVSSFINSLPITIDHSTHSSTRETAEDILDEAASTALPVTTKSFNLIQACILTSGTLILLGLWGRLHLPPTALDRRKSWGSTKTSNGNPSSPISLRPIRVAFVRMLSVGLPFLATIELGGARVGMLLLLAVAGGIINASASVADKATTKPWKRALAYRRSICVVLALCAMNDLFLQRQDKLPSSIIRGYVALTKSIFFFQPPFPTLTPTSRVPPPRRTSAAYPGAPTSAWRTTAPPVPRSMISPLITSSADVKMTMITGCILGVVSLFCTASFASAQILTPASIALMVACISCSTSLFIFGQPAFLQSQGKIGFVVGVSVCVVFSLYMNRYSWIVLTTPFTLSLFSYVAVQLDTGGTLPFKKDHSHSSDHANHDHSSHGQHAHHHHSHSHSHHGPSKFTRFLLRLTEGNPLLQGILLEKESRRIVYFMGVNLAFMFVQTFYALVAGSLGLLSDSIHMFFDCVGLLAGLVAAVMSKWPPNSKFPYGYGKVETLSGLGNGIFLIIISVEIIWESFERFVEGAELRRLNELLVVSVGGLLVNLIGLKFIGHAHHGHGHGHSHDHDHSHGPEHSHGHKRKSSQDSNDEPQPNGLHEEETPAKSLIMTKAHGHHHENENMAGIYLHILADTMGSVAVIASTLLTSYTGWSFWDPIASCVIAILIILASCPLVISSSKRLLLTVPYEVEYTLRNTLQELSDLRGVAGYSAPRFWLDDADSHDHNHDHPHDHAHSHSPSHSDSSGDPSHTHDDSCTPAGQKILGVIHIAATRSADLQDARARVELFLRSRDMDIVVHVARQGQEPRGPPADKK